MTCCVDGCERPVYRKRMCATHRSRLQRTGDVSADVPIAHRCNNPEQVRECATCADAEWLMDDGVIEDVIATRLGFGDRESLRRHLRRHHRQDLVDRMTQLRKGSK